MFKTEQYPATSKAPAPPRARPAHLASQTAAHTPEHPNGAEQLESARKQLIAERRNSMPKNTFHNTGDFRGAAVFQGSTIHNAGQIAGTIAHADQGSRAELQALLQQLGATLKDVPSDKVEDADAVAASAEDLMKETAKDKPNKSRLRSLGGTLVNMAKAIGAAAPKAVSLAEKIVSLVDKIHGAAGLPPSISI
jgi:hypothetical protein